jgi:pantoate--beta-alanine ligase
MISASTVADLAAALAQRQGTVGLVPTMGAYHEGHLSLMRAAREECDLVVVSLFVNPAQFGEAADLERYPRDLARDARLAAGTGVDVLFAPAVEEIYPPGYQTWVEVTEVSRRLEGGARPGHFRAVATVCLKLFNLVRPDRAYFGQKDAQQVAVLERMVRDLDLDLGLELRVLPTVRDADGLALSSRNVFLGPEERRAALALPRALARGAEVHRSGGAADRAARELLTREGPELSVDYLELVRLNGRLVLAGAVRVGSTRLIDNVVLEEVRR